MEAEDFTYHFNPERTHQGLALVIANFTSGRRKRKGAEADLKYMKKTFKRLGFKVDCRENVTSSKLESLLSTYSQQLLKSYDCFVFAISSHGMEIVQRDEKGNSVHRHAIEMFDEKYIYTSQILDYFNDENCIALGNKPKLFFIQACRIPDTMSTWDHRNAGVGFDSGIIRHGGKVEQKTTGDQTDSGGSSWEKQKTIGTQTDSGGSSWEKQKTIGTQTDSGGSSWEKQKTIVDQTDSGGSSRETEIDSVEECDVSDTDVEEDEPSMSDSSIETIAKGQGVANVNEDPYPQNSPEVTADLADDLVPAKRRHANPADTHGSGDDIDPARGRKLSPAAPVEITLVPCHNDMLIMFASPQGHYAFRNETVGSYMLQLLFKCVEENYGNGRLAQNETNILDVLMDVTARMSEMKFMGGNEFTIVPCVVHTLKKDVIFTHAKNMRSTKFTAKPSEIVSSLFTNKK